MIIYLSLLVLDSNGRSLLKLVSLLHCISARESPGASLFSMTMVIENQNRQYGGMGFDNVYHGNMQHSNPQFSDPWSATHTSSHPNPSMYATSMGANHLGMNHVKQEDVTRPTAISMPYSSIPVSAPSLVAGTTYHNAAGYGSSQMLGMQHEMPRTTFEQAPTYTTAFTPANYAPMNYGQTLHQQQQQQQQDARRISHA